MSEASLSWQSESLPGSVEPSSSPFLLVSSLAFLAASLARDAAIAFSSIAFAVEGFSSKYSDSLVLTVVSTSARISELPSFALVWLSNWASSSLTLMTAHMPSLQSSPDSALSEEESMLFFLA